MTAKPDRRLTIFAASAVLLFAFVSVQSAHAGLGSMLKDKAQKALQKGTTNTSQPGASSGGSGNVKFDDEVLELNEARVTALIAGMKAGEKAVPNRAPMVAKRQKLQADHDALVSKYGKDIAATQEKREKIQDCWEQALRKRTEPRQKDLEQKMKTDPAAQARMMQLGMQMAQAQAKGDTTAMAQFQAQMMGMVMPTAADSAAVKVQCGAIPPVHPMAARIDSLTDAVQAAETALRESDDKVIAAQAQVSGQEGAALAMSKERILLYLQAVKANQKPQGFSAAELKALDAHRAELETAFAAYMD